MIPWQAYLDVALTLSVVLALAPVLGRYMARVYTDRPTLLDGLLGPVDRFLFRLLGVSRREEMGWKEYAANLLLLNAIALVAVFLLLVTQAGLPLNALGAPNMSWDLAFHTASSFVTNTNYQHYVPEQQLSLFSALFGLQTLMYVSPATGLCVFVAFSRGFQRRDGTVGNFYVDFVRTLTRIFLPLVILGTLGFLLAGVPETLAQSVTAYSPLAGAQVIPLGPVASWNAIMLLGTNGGGYFNANLAQPLANPTAATLLLGVVLMLLIPLATPFAFGYLIRRPGEAYPLVVSAIAIFLLALGIFLYFSLNNPFLPPTISQAQGFLSGAEARFSLPESALFEVSSIYSNTGASVMAIGALTPWAQTSLLFGMFLQASPGGDGTGFGMLLIYVILAVFVGGLMVGRTPEYLGKKVGRDQVKWSAAALLSHPFLILIPVALAVVLGLGFAPGTLNPATFTSILYEFTSESANNGSGIGGIADTTVFYNVAGALVMLVGRYLPILAMLAIGGSLSREGPQPVGPGTLRTESLTFTIYLILFLIVIAGLLFLPVLVLGPLSQLG